MEVKIFGGHTNEGKVQKQINKWIKDNSNVDIVDIKYGYGVGTYGTGPQGVYSAMIIYRQT